MSGRTAAWPAQALATVSPAGSGRGGAKNLALRPRRAAVTLTIQLLLNLDGVMQQQTCVQVCRTEKRGWCDLVKLFPTEIGDPFD